MNKNAIMIMMCLIGSLLFAQERKCATMENNTQLLKANPGMKLIQGQIEKYTAQKSHQAGKTIDGDIITIPVVVHIVYSKSEENISDAQIQSQIAVLNEDFRYTNSDRDNVWPQAADIQIEFCLATQDPNGNPTNGITRKSSARTSWGVGSAVKRSSSGGVDAWNPSLYLNMWVANIGDDTLGYAQFPGGPKATDGVVMGPQYFGSKAKGNGFFLANKFDLGRTTTHEVGHYFNLRHIWGDGNCNADDFVSDTPSASGSSSGCAIGRRTCGNVNMVQNYMDYTDDRCMNLFTQGQRARMRAVLLGNGVRNSLANSTKCGSTTPTPPTPPNQGCSSAFPYSEGFENGLGDWKNATNDDIEWTSRSGETPSTGTGPASAIEGSDYIYVEASGNGQGYPNKRAILNSPCFDLSGLSSASFGFKYHMLGSSIGQLAVEARIGSSGSWTTIFSKTGAQGSDWNTAAIDLAGYTGESNVQLRFNTATASSWNADVAIDAVTLTSGTVSPTPTPGECNDIVLSFTFDRYPEDISYEIRDAQGAVISSGGSYGSEADNSTLNLTGCLDDGCYDLIVKDAFGDGLCCRYGNGSYSLSANGTVLVSGATFTSGETNEFCLGAGTKSTGARAIEGTYKAISVFPNPAIGGVLNISGAEIGMPYSIVNIHGQVVVKGELSNRALDISDLQNGFYIIQFVNGRSIEKLPFITANK